MSGEWQHAALGWPTSVSRYWWRKRATGLSGVIDWHVMTTIRRPSPVGRIVMLVINESHRGEGIGTGLVKSACDRMRAAGCRLVEVTSNDRLVDAHRFYEGLGFEATSRRFAKSL